MLDVAPRYLPDIAGAAYTVFDQIHGVIDAFELDRGTRLGREAWRAPCAKEKAFITDLQMRAPDLKWQGVNADDAGRQLTVEFKTNIQTGPSTSDEFREQHLRPNGRRSFDHRVENR